MNELGSELMSIVVPSVTTAVGVLTAWGLAALRGYIKHKTSNESALQAFDVISDLVHSSVVSLNQTTRKAFEDGKLSTAEKREYKTSVLASVLGQIPDATKAIMEKNVKDLDEYVSTRIEAEVFRQKARI